MKMVNRQLIQRPEVRERSSGMSSIISESSVYNGKDQREKIKRLYEIIRVYREKSS